MSIDKKESFEYLSDRPEGVDLFLSKSHEKIACAIADLIKNSKEKIIGLEGEWGSGKSNVVEIIKNKLKDTHHVFIYDAWGHQEDLQRRSFLEELNKDITDNKIVTDVAKWEEKLEDLLLDLSVKT